MERLSDAGERIDFPASFEDLIERYRSLTPEERAERQAARDRQHADELRRKNLEHRRDLYRGLSEIDEKYRDCTLESYEPRTASQRKALDAAWRVVEDPLHIGLGLTGRWGQAKSILTASIVNTCNDRLIPAVFVTWVNFIDVLRETYDNDGKVRKGKREIIDHYTAATVLAIDDIDKEPLTVDIARHLFRVLDRRDKRKRPLIITANHSLAEIGNAWKLGAGVNRVEQRPDAETSGACYRRLKELCGLNPVCGFTGTWMHLEPERGAA